MLGSQNGQLPRQPPEVGPSRGEKALQDIYNAEDKEHAAAAVKAFAKRYGAKFSKAVKKIVDDEAELLASYDFPAEHWRHLPDNQPHRVDLRNRPAADQGHRRGRLPGRGPRDGLQAR